MTRAQERKLEAIRHEAEKSLFWGGPEKYEVKKWEVEEFVSFVSLVVETGMKGDEGTMAEVFARDRAHLFIGSRGKVTYPVHHKKKDGTWKHYEKDYTFLLAAVVDQR